ncbi:hypothetical protein SAMN05518847_110188 [Paenibacillus sp. OV219]|nr:hypothetical protein SAMN05518847_110188 [Paenibacillus sp. OV219]
MNRFSSYMEGNALVSIKLTGRREESDEDDDDKFRACAHEAVGFRFY